MTTLNPPGSLLIAEVLILLAAENCFLLPLVRERITPTVNPDS